MRPASTVIPVHYATTADGRFMLAIPSYRSVDVNETLSALLPVLLQQYAGPSDLACKTGIHYVAELRNDDYPYRTRDPVTDSPGGRFFAFLRVNPVAASVSTFRARRWTANELVPALNAAGAALGLHVCFRPGTHLNAQCRGRTLRVSDFLTYHGTASLMRHHCRQVGLGTFDVGLFFHSSSDGWYALSLAARGKSLAQKRLLRHGMLTRRCSPVLRPVPLQGLLFRATRH